MTLSNLLEGTLVKVLGIKPKIHTPAEKEKLRSDMIQANRRQDRDITKCAQKYIGGLCLRQIELPHAGGWLVSKPGNPEKKIIYYIHGGGFTGACTKDRMPFVSCIVKEFGYNVFSVDYRLAPEFMQPCALNDCLDPINGFWAVMRQRTFS